MDHLYDRANRRDPHSAFDSTTFDCDGEVKVNEDVQSASISPSGRDIVLASRNGLLVIDLDFLYSEPRRFSHHSRWDVADVQWSPFPERAYWIVSTSNQKALVWNLESYSSRSPIEHVLHAHTRAITDINFSTHDPDMLATCAVDSFVHCWDLRIPARPAMTFADWNAGATQVKWNRQDENIIASSHDRFLKIWDKRKGAVPLRTIEAHSTKIYGVDWNRTRLTGIATCSLDRTIKFWDYSHAYDEPERTIQTPYPVWRARHTPFGWGMLAMPQRGDYNLHLYDRRMNSDTPKEGPAAPTRSFTGHRDNVYEFLWRSRGDVENGIDGREFQLVSWGADKYLRLHQMDVAELKAVGYEKGDTARTGLHLVRSGAVYHSFRDETKEYPHRPQLDLPPGRTFKPQGLGALISLVGLNRAAPTMVLPHTGQRFTTSFKATAKPAKSDSNPMKWIEGVRIGGRPGDSPIAFQGKEPAETPEGLSEEMMYVSKRYKKVKFERADVHGRHATVTLHGPWGTAYKNVFLRVSFDFPVSYPFLSRPELRFERTHSGVADDVMRNLQDEVVSIMEYYRNRRRGCLEAVITYLLGEKDFEESMLVKPHDGLEVPFTSPADEDTSDEEAGVAADELEASGTVLPPQINVPVARTCGAIWNGNGQLVCFFLPKPEPTPTFSLNALRAVDAKTHQRKFEVFGRLIAHNIATKERTIGSDEEMDEDSSESQTGNSSFSSSDESEDVSRLPNRFKPPLAWRAAVLRTTQRPSSHSGSGVLKKIVPTKAGSLVSMMDCSRFLPSKRFLASEYLLFGHGPAVCDHNAAVAERHGLATLSAVWQLCKIILYNEVPLEIMDQPFRKDPILVMAKRNIVRIRRKDSGLDLGFDDPESVRNPQLTGRIKWGNHPLGGVFLIPRLFEHFERQADVQMLAMLSCIFSEPAGQEGTQYSLLDLRPADMPIALKAPAFSLDYFPTKDIAWSQYHDRMPAAKLPTTPLSNHNAGDYFSRQPTTFGSMSSSNGPWAGDDSAPSAPITSFSSGNTPPVLSLSRQTTVGSSLSTSPDQDAARIVRRSQSSFSTAISQFTRFSLTTGSSSPPVLEKPRAETELASSAPSAGFFWGGGSFTGTGSSSPHSPIIPRKSKSRAASFATHDSTYDSSGSDTEAISDDENDDASVIISRPRALEPSPTVLVSLKNQHLFDEEGHASVPLLNPANQAKYAWYRMAYANLLSQWSLHTAHAEVLKFNGLTPYYATDKPYLDAPLTWSSSNSLEADVTSFKRTIQVQVTPTSDYFAHVKAASSGRSTPLNPNAPEFVPQPLAHPPQPQHSNPATLKSVLPQMPTGSGLLAVPTHLGMYTHHPHEKQGPQFEQVSKDFLLAKEIVHFTQDIRSENDVFQKSKLPIEQRICVACYEAVQGLHVVCVSGKHRAHRDCIAEQDEQQRTWVNLRGIGLGCVCEGGVLE